MRSLAAIMAVFLVLALVAREINWKTRGMLLGAIIIMIILLMRK